MKRKQLILYMTIFSLLSTLLISTSLIISAPSVVDPPIVRDDAPSVIKFDEDSPAYFLNLFDIFDDKSGSENFTIWTGSDWDAKYDRKEFLVEILDNDTAKITPKPNKFCNKQIIINDTNAVGSAEHNLTIIIKSINDPPVIEMVGNVKVTDLNFIKVFLYENEWYNATVTASDADGDNLVFIDNSSIFDINYLTGSISFLPGPNDVGKSIVNITVSDINGSKYEDWINIEFTILNVNNPPSKTVIIYPGNGSTHYPYDWIEFGGKSYDPDIMYGDYLTFNWYSDRDGLLGTGEEIEVYYMSEGKHVITLNVSDSEGKFDTDSIILKVEDYKYYDKYYLDLYFNQDFLIIKQGDEGTCYGELYNYGSAETNVSIEYKKYMDFDFEIDIEFDNSTMERDQSRPINVTVSITEDATIGFYQLVIRAMPEVDSDDDDDDKNEDGDYYEYYGENTVTIKIIVITNNSDEPAKGAPKPEWKVGNKWVYSLVSTDTSTAIGNMDGTVDLEITADESIEVNDEIYDVFKMELDSNLQYSEDNNYDPTSSYLPYSDINMTIGGVNYYQKSNIASVSSELYSEIKMQMGPEKYEYRTETKSNYDPPIDEYQFPIKSGESWQAESYVEESERRSGFPYDYKDEYSEPDFFTETRKYVCMGMETVKTPAGSFEAFLTLLYYTEKEYDYSWDYGNDWDYRSGSDNTNSRSRQSVVDTGGEGYTIDYYSPKVGFSVKQVSYFQDYNYDNSNWSQEYVYKENAIIELISYSTPPTKNDTDNDDLPDFWEDRHEVENPNADEDNDGFTNLEEFDNGTDPKNKNDTPVNPIDDDDDGLPDTWERDHGLDPTDPLDAKKDYDNDGFTNEEEFEERTYPDDPEDHPIVETEDYKRDDSLFGMGKFGDMDMVYFFIIIITIVIVVLIMTAILLKRRKRDKLQKQRTLEKSEERIYRAPTDSMDSDSTAAENGSQVHTQAQEQEQTQRQKTFKPIKEYHAPHKKQGQNIETTYSDRTSYQPYPKQPQPSPDGYYAPPGNKNNYGHPRSQPQQPPQQPPQQQSQQQPYYNRRQQHQSQYPDYNNYDYQKPRGPRDRRYY